LNKKASQQLDPLRREFIKYILSKDGQTQTEVVGIIRSPMLSESRT
jgi:hypothetical protein